MRYPERAVRTRASTGHSCRHPPSEHVAVRPQHEEEVAAGPLARDRPLLVVVARRDMGLGLAHDPQMHAVVEARVPESPLQEQGAAPVPVRCLGAGERAPEHLGKRRPEHPCAPAARRREQACCKQLGAPPATHTAAAQRCSSSHASSASPRRSACRGTARARTTAQGRRSSPSACGRGRTRTPT